MNDEQLDDLKQFIDARISQSESHLRSEITTGFAGVGEAIEDVYQLVDDTVVAFDARLTKLEQAA